MAINRRDFLATTIGTVITAAGCNRTPPETRHRSNHFDIAPGISATDPANIQFDDAEIVVCVGIDGRKPHRLQQITLSPFGLQFDFEDGQHRIMEIDYNKFANDWPLKVVVTSEHSESPVKIKLKNEFGTHKSLNVYLEARKPEGAPDQDHFEIDLGAAEHNTVVGISAGGTRAAFTGLSEERFTQAMDKDRNLKYEDRPLGDLYLDTGCAVTHIGGAFIAHQGPRYVSFRDLNGDFHTPPHPQPVPKQPKRVDEVQGPAALNLGGATRPGF